MREMAIKDNGWLAPAATKVHKRCSPVFWRTASYAGFSGAALLMTAGLAVSALSAIGVLLPTKETGYAVVILLFSSFISAFFGAHSLDRLTDSNAVGEESDSDVDSEGKDAGGKR